MNGTPGFQDVRSSNLPTSYRILDKERHRSGTESGTFFTLKSDRQQRMKRHSTRVHHKLVLLCLSTLILLSGCFPMLGYRPALSTTVKPDSIPACKSESLAKNDSDKAACEEYYNAVKWGEDLAQAYTTRGFMNEWSAYIAGAVGIIGGAVVGALTATDDGNTDAAKITPPVTAAVVALFALNQSDDKATAYGESIIAIEESLAAADRHVSHNKTKEGFQLGSDILKDSIRQEIVNLDIRMVAIRKKTAASIPTTTALSPQSFKTPTQQAVNFTFYTKNLETDSDGISAIIVPHTAIEKGEVKNDRVSFTLTNPNCQDYLVMLSVRNKLILPARNLRCEN